MILIFIFLISTSIFNLASSGCILTTPIDQPTSTLNCQGLSSLESMKPLKTTGIFVANVTNGEIPILPAGSFDDFRELRRIYLTKNSIEGIEYGAFSSESVDTMLPFLMVLDLSENIIETLPSEIFNHSGALELNLSSNGLKVIEVGAFRNMATLRKLDLSYNAISDQEGEHTLPLGIFQDTPTLHQLNLSYNSLESIKVGAFSMLPILFNLDLSHNNLRYLPGATFIGCGIKELYLNDNNLVFFEYPNAKNYDVVINLINNDFDCEVLAKIMSTMGKGFFVKGNALTQENINGIACKENNEEEEENNDGNEDILSEMKILKYLIISTLCTGLIIMGHELFCKKNGGDEDDDPVLKEVSPLH